MFGENLADPTPLTGEELPQLARDITAGSATPFDAAIALQRWFTTDGGFTYSTQIEGGSDEDALATFLDERVGYCEQFAATMALMARSVGIPARVVVGFTQGRLEGNQWVVRGTDAHAWPELWMGSAGWVRFEPTPGAPTTTTPGYTSVHPVPAGPTAAPTQSSAAAVGSSTGSRPRCPTRRRARPGQGRRDRELPVSLDPGIVLALTALLLLLPAAVRLVRRRRRIRTGDGESAYREVVDTMVDLRLGSESSTPRSTLAAVAALVGAAWRRRAGRVGERRGGHRADPAGGRVAALRVSGGRLPQPGRSLNRCVAGPAGAQAAGVMLAERQDAGPISLPAGCPGR